MFISKALYQFDNLIYYLKISYDCNASKEHCSERERERERETERERDLYDHKYHYFEHQA